jgi:hypothetical protein
MRARTDASENTDIAGRRRRRPLKIRNRGHAYEVAVPEGLHQAIESERENLSKAESLLGCLAISMEYGGDAGDGGPYYPDVAQLARELVRKSINGLDSLNLQERLAQHRIKEEFRLSCAELECAVPLWLAFVHGGEIDRAPKRRVACATRAMRLHRRHYGRVLSRSVASADSASANICG